MKLYAIGGMCNRLRAILSYRAIYGELDIVWEPDETVAYARWEDIFQPLDGVRFLTSGLWDVEDFAPAKDAPPGWERAYRDVVPTPPLMERIAEVKAWVGPTYLAVHIRRTDHVPNIQTLGMQVETLEEFGRWAQQWAELPLYLATDNRETQDRFPDWVVGTRFLPSSEIQGLEDHHRNGPLADAVVDLFVCAAALRFKGSASSSFSDTIEALRRSGPNHILQESPGGLVRILHPDRKHAIYREAAEKYGLRTFVETGTNEGEAVFQMLRSTVDQIVSIEVCESLYRKQCQRFAGEPRVTIIHGSSAVELPKVLAGLNAPAVFWLDAHAGGIEDLDEDHFPLRRELMALAAWSHVRQSAIFIDDARFFGYGYYPTLREIGLILGREPVLIEDIARVLP
jgi:hypothetical protein